MVITFMEAAHGGTMGNPPYTDAYVIENERAKLDEMAAVVDKRIWAVANGKDIPAEYDYSETRKLYDVPTNFKNSDNDSPAGSCQEDVHHR